MVVVWPIHSHPNHIEQKTIICFSCVRYQISVGSSLLQFVRRILSLGSLLITLQVEFYCVVVQLYIELRDDFDNMKIDE